MSSYYHYNSHQHPTSANAQSASSSHHSGRGRRAPRVPQNSHKQFRGVKPLKELDQASVSSFREQFESARSFDLDDDLQFCPNLLTDSDLVSIHSSSSDRSSSTGSPDSSPSSQQAAPSFSLNSNSNPYIPSGYQSQPSNLKLHQPAATRIRNAIPIVNPSTGISMSSPPQSVSPTRMQQTMGRRW